MLCWVKVRPSWPPWSESRQRHLRKHSLQRAATAAAPPVAAAATAAMQMQPPGRATGWQALLPAAALLRLTSRHLQIPKPHHRRPPLMFKLTTAATMQAVQPAPAVPCRLRRPLRRQRRQP